MDDIITRLLEGKDGKQVQLTEGEIHEMCAKAKEIFIREPSLLELKSPLRICGDIHGQFSDLIRVFEVGGYPPASNYLFLGNYVGYGKQSIETFFLLLAYKIKYPNKIFLLRGKHEFDLTNYNFYHQFKRRFNVNLRNVIKDCFDCLPFAAIIQDKIFCVNGGLSPMLKDLDQIRNMKRRKPSTNGWDSDTDSGTLHDLLWPDSEAIFGRIENERGDIIYRRDIVVPEFLDKHGLYLICRSNRFVKGGYEFFDQRRLVTIFTASNFRGEFRNSGAMLSVDESFICSLKMFKSCDAKQKIKGSSNITWSPGPPPSRSELEATPPLDAPEEELEATPQVPLDAPEEELEATPPLDAPNSSGAFNILDAPNSSGAFNVLDARMSFDDAVLCSFQILIPFNKKRNVREGNSSEQPKPSLPPPPPPIRKAQKQ